MHISPRGKLHGGGSRTTWEPLPEDLRGHNQPGCTCTWLGKAGLGGDSVPWRPPPTTRPTRDSLKLSTLTREGPGLKNIYVQALESPSPAANGLAGRNSHWLPLQDLECINRWRTIINKKKARGGPALTNVYVQALESPPPT